uniref:non-specific serine/threonine protein kinase n=1 Tax=Ciona savignyi TaxID=51511 RepID=H2YIX0_CIOSA
METSYCDGLELIQQGAEAKIYRTEFLGKECIVKQRFPKKYRLPEIDEKLTKKRLSQEIRALQRCRKAGIPTPAILFTDLVGNVIFMEEIPGVTMKEYISRNSGKEQSKAVERAVERIGETLALMHNADIIHGDLTHIKYDFKEFPKQRYCLMTVRKPVSTNFF